MVSAGLILAGLAPIEGLAVVTFQTDPNLWNASLIILGAITALAIASVVAIFRGRQVAGGAIAAGLGILLLVFSWGSVTESPGYWWLLLPSIFLIAGGTLSVAAGQDESGLWEREPRRPAP